MICFDSGDLTQDNKNDGIGNGAGLLVVSSLKNGAQGLDTRAFLVYTVSLCDQ